MYFLKLCVRNVFRHTRRSMATMIVVAIGFLSLNVFGGYVANVFRGLQDQVVHGEGVGHLTVARPGYFEKGRINPTAFLLSQEEVARVVAVAKSEPGVLLATPRLGVTGLISNGHLSTVFLAEGVVPEDSQRIRGAFRADRRGGLRSDNPHGAVVAKDLASALDLKEGSSAVAFASTSEGMANALDLDVQQLFDTGNAATNDKAIIVPLSLARSLFDTEGAERVVLLLTDTAHTDKASAELAAKFKSAGLDLEIRGWEELSPYYRQVKGFLGMVFMFIFCIVFVVVMLSVANTMSMTIVERTREIGTLRALGMKRWSIVRLFTMEGLLLGVAGSLLGLPLALAVAFGVNALNLRYSPPSSSDTVQLQVDVEPVKLALSLLLLACTSGAAALVPAVRASRSQIVDALGHV
jgi:putative ABC transport system permease protein